MTVGDQDDRRRRVDRFAGAFVGSDVCRRRYRAFQRLLSRGSCRTGGGNNGGIGAGLVVPVAGGRRMRAKSNSSKGRNDDELFHGLGSLSDIQVIVPRSDPIRTIQHDHEAVTETSMPSAGRYWFPAKRYGEGIPGNLAGWAAFLVLFGLMVVGAVIVLPEYSVAGFVAYVVVLCMIFAAVCWWKGEPPRWRWGGE
jgi:hypothetical protein